MSLAEQAKLARLQRKRQQAGEFIPLSSGSAAKTQHKPEKHIVNRVELDKEVSTWEVEVIRRGARGAEQSSTRLSSNPSTPTTPTTPSLRRSRNGGSVLSLEKLKQRLSKAVTTLSSACHRLQREVDAMEETKSQSEADAVTAGRLLSTASSRFEFFQSVRVYVRDLCACLHSKASLIQDYEDAVNEASSQYLANKYLRQTQDLRDELNDAIMKGAMLETTCGGKSFACIPYSTHEHMLMVT